MVHDEKVMNFSDSGKGSLRAAIDAANSEPAGSIGRIDLDLPTIGGEVPGIPPLVPAIRPTTDLPALTAPVVIDGYTQPGSAPRTATTAANNLVVIDASGLTRGLKLDTKGSRISGFGISGADGPGIMVNGDQNTITGSYIGVTNDGAAEANADDGISIDFADNTVGGSGVADRNVVSANKRYGVHIVGHGNTIQDHRLGIAPGSAVALENTLAGVEIEGDDNTVSDSEIGDNGPGGRDHVRLAHHGPREPDRHGHGSCARSRQQRPGCQDAR